VKGTSIFAQITNRLLSRQDFQRIVNKHQGDKHSKGMKCWEQHVAMMFLHLSKVTSLREIIGGLRSATGKLVHLGLNKVHPKSTLSYANAHRPWQIYQDVFFTVLAHCKSTLHTGKRFTFKNELLSMDSTTVDLCLNLFPWANFRQTKGAVKIHMLLDHDGYFPTFAVITDGKAGDAPIARTVLPDPLLLPSGSIAVLDRGYVDFELFAQLCTNGVYFVTRPKKGMLWEVVEEREVPKGKNILRDTLIVFTSKKAQEVLGQHLFRIVESVDPKTGKSIEILTNHLHFGATTIAKIYKDRWSIENFFKVLKQNLKIKTFVGTTENALRIQIWTALTTILALKYLKALSTFDWSLSNLIAILRLSLFTYRDLQDWLNDPYTVPLWEPTTQIEIDYG
jgi:hypothetical protein